MEFKRNNDHLYQQLVRLGDMMGDGLHLEPDGKWIEEGYKNICMMLGLIKGAKKRYMYLTLILFAKKL